MIVKNEATVIPRCLKSVIPMIDTWCIVDTGSSDATMDIIRSMLRDIPGTLYERPWVDFATNRTEAIELARDMADYSFIMDADDVVEAPLHFSGLTADAYTVLIKNSGITYRRVQMVKNSLQWRYRGVLHEFLECPEAGPAQDLPLTIQCGHDSARARDPDTYRKDAAMLEDAFQKETDPFLKARYGFYLAQSYRDHGERGWALVWYLWRADAGFWIEEVYISLLNAARLSESNSIGLYERATETTPNRAEAYHGLARLYRSKGEFEKGFQTAKRAVELVQSEGGLFVEEWIYQWGVLDELAINGYWSGHYRESLDACELILSLGQCTDMDRIKVNANFARRKLLVN